MNEKAKESLDLAYGYVEQIARASENPKYETTESIRELSQVIYHLGAAVVSQIAAGADR